MALSMEEQKQLSQIASRLSQDDPRLAARLTAFDATPRRRIRIIAAIIVAAVIAATGIAAAIAVALS